MPPKLKKDSWESYIYMLAKHNFNWRTTSDTRYTKKYLEEENNIEELRLKLDHKSEMYNSYSPIKK